MSVQIYTEVTQLSRARGAAFALLMLLAMDAYTDTRTSYWDVPRIAAEGRITVQWARKQLHTLYGLGEARPLMEGRRVVGHYIPRLGTVQPVSPQADPESDQYVPDVKRRTDTQRIKQRTAITHEQIDVLRKMHQDTPPVPRKRGTRKQPTP